MKPIVPIIMGSKSDLEHGQKIADALAKFGIEAVIRVGSAHKTPDHVLEMVEKYEADPRPKVYVTIAGRSNALSGFFDGQVLSPVIACPPMSSSFAGADIYSSLRMPSGIAPAVVLEPKGAALLAAKILGIHDPEVRAAVEASRQGYIDRIVADDGEINS